MCNIRVRDLPAVWRVPWALGNDSQGDELEGGCLTAQRMQFKEAQLQFYK